MCVNPNWIIPTSEGYKFSFKEPVKKVAFIDSETGEYLEPFPVGCGKCLECINNHKMQWSIRLYQESTLYDRKCFITLTYTQAPASGVCKLHVQKFIKSLRNRHKDLKIRYFFCGEYGSQGKRPHYHACIFGYDFPDKKEFRRDKKGFIMYRSAELEDLWKYGYSSILPINITTLGYTTKDMQKLLPLQDAREPPFTLMSTHPAIGYAAFDKRLSDGKIYVPGGYSCTIPRTYIRKMIAEGDIVSDYYRLWYELPQRELTGDRLKAEDVKRKNFRKKIIKKY